MRRAIRYVALITATVVAAIVFSQLPVLGQEGRGGRGGEGRQGGQAQSLPEAPPIGFFGSYRIAADKINPSKLPIIGAWRINFDRSDPALKLANRFKDTGTVIYSAENGGIKQEVFLYLAANQGRLQERLHRRRTRVLFQARRQEYLPEPAGTKRAGPDGGHVAGQSQHAVSRARDQGRRR